MSVRTSALKYFSLVGIAVRETLHYPNKAITELFSTAVRLGVLLILYSYAYRYFGKDVGGISVQTACWSIAMYFILLSLHARHLFYAIDVDIVSGVIETLVNKPFNYVGYRVALILGRNIPGLVVTMLGSVIILMLTVGVPSVNITPLWSLEVFLLAILGLTLAYLIYAIIGMSSFWLNNGKPLYWLSDKAIMILGGAFIPVALFPEIIKLIAKYSPFGATMFFSYIFYPSFPANALLLISLQIGWIVVAALALRYIYRAARRKLTINGG